MDDIHYNKATTISRVINKFYLCIFYNKVMNKSALKL